MRILHVHSGNRYGGVESALRVMARPHGSVESVFALSFEGRLSEEIRAAGAEVSILGDVRASRPFSVLRARARLLALFRQEHFDATLAHSAWALSLLANCSQPPLVFYQHDIMTGRQWTERLAGHVHPDLIVANSAFTAQTTSKVFPGARPVVVYPPTDLPVRILSQDERASLRARHSVPHGTVVILIAARFEKWKGHALLLESLALLRESPQWRVWIAGEPQNAREHSVRDTLKPADDRVQFLGHVSDVAAIMQAADIYCQPNTGPEPFGLSFVEALACGLPVVATSLGGAREILEPAWGLLEWPKAAEIAAMLQRLLDDPDLRRRLGELGPARALDLCNPETQISALGHSIEPLLNRKAA
jgi:glycosyltransferase involved in cell wall biosynthesis